MLYQLRLQVHPGLPDSRALFLPFFRAESVPTQTQVRVPAPPSGRDGSIQPHRRLLWAQQAQRLPRQL